MITCPKCAKDNQDHYKFCLGCGAELPRGVAGKPFAIDTPTQALRYAPGGAKPVIAPTPAAAPAASPGHTAARASSRPPLAAAFPVRHDPAPKSVPPPAARAPSAPPPGPGPTGSASQPGLRPSSPCPQCGHPNTVSNLFCGSCGYRLGGSPAVAPAAGSMPPAARGVIFTALRADGSEAGTYALPSGTVTLGRETGNIFASDSYLSPRHATFKQPAPGVLLVKDENSLNGVYKKLLRDVATELKPGDIFRIGQEIIRFENLAPLPVSPDGVERLGAPSKGYVGRLALVIGRDDTGNAFPLPDTGVHLGRERGDILFPEDGYVSGLHCRIAVEDGHVSLTDLGSSNGTFMRLRVETDLRHGDVILMGQQLFRITMS